MRKTVLFILISLIAVCVIVTVYSVDVASRAIAVNIDYSTALGSQSTLQSISMPVEYVNYTVSMVNGSLWATVDGVFPMHIPLEWVGQELPMLYPTPPGVTSISIEVDGQSADYSNYTQAYPDILHYTYLGEWQMIVCTIQPASPDFLMTIHYHHPISLVNGTYMFLYDLNISPYLSNSSTESMAHFSVIFLANCSNINIYTVPGDSSMPRDNTRTPVNFNKQRNRCANANIQYHFKLLRTSPRRRTHNFPEFTIPNSRIFFMGNSVLANCNGSGFWIFRLLQETQTES